MLRPLRSRQVSRCRWTPEATGDSKGRSLLKFTSASDYAYLFVACLFHGIGFAGTVDPDQSIQGTVTYRPMAQRGQHAREASGHDRTEIAPRRLFGSSPGRLAFAALPGRLSHDYADSERPRSDERHGGPNGHIGYCGNRPYCRRVKR